MALKSTSDICKLYGKSKHLIYYYIKKRKDPLPVVSAVGDVYKSYTFDSEVVAEWMLKRGIEPVE